MEDPASQDNAKGDGPSVAENAGRQEGDGSSSSVIAVTAVDNAMTDADAEKASVTPGKEVMTEIGSNHTGDTSDESTKDTGGAKREPMGPGATCNAAASSSSSSCSSSSRVHQQESTSTTPDMADEKAANKKQDESAISSIEDSVSNRKRPAPSEVADPASSTTTPVTTTNHHHLPKQPIKKARTAYFIFAADKREEIKKANPGEPVGVLARITGQMWNALTEEQKIIYQRKAAEERERVSQEIAKYNLDQIEMGEASTTSTSSMTTISAIKDPLSLEIPQARLKRIIKLDPDVKGVSKESSLLLGKVAELFTAKLGMDAVKVAALQNRRKLLPEDVAQICQTREQFLFLKDDIKDLVKEQLLDKKKASSSSSSSGTTTSTNQKLVAAAANSKPLTSYFGVGGATKSK